MNPCSIIDVLGVSVCLCICAISKITLLDSNLIEPTVCLTARLFFRVCVCVCLDSPKQIICKMIE